MGNFGEDLRMERISRGIALEDITAVTKIGTRYLEALEQENFRLLPGGILNKGIVRGYASAVGLDQSDWTERFLKAYAASGQMVEEERDWLEFASNVGKARIQRSEAIENRLRWFGVILLVLVVAAGAFLAVRYYGLRAHWWPSMLPLRMVMTRFAMATISIPSRIEMEAGPHERCSPGLCRSAEALYLAAPAFHMSSIELI
jgi:cytoskeletal protein RodZ